MRNLLKIPFIFFIIIPIVFGCEKDDVKKEEIQEIEEEIIIDPNNPFLGKWELFMRIVGNNPPDTMFYDSPKYYKEYLPDSVLKFHIYEDSIEYYAKYWIQNELLHIEETHYAYSGNLVDTLILLSSYKYRFSEDSLMVNIDFYDPMPYCPYTRIFNRIW